MYLICRNEWKEKMLFREHFNYCKGNHFEWNFMKKLSRYLHKNYLEFKRSINSSRFINWFRVNFWDICYGCVWNKLCLYFMTIKKFTIRTVQLQKEVKMYKKLLNRLDDKRTVIRVLQPRHNFFSVYKKTYFFTEQSYLEFTDIIFTIFEFSFYDFSPRFSSAFSRRSEEGGK